MSTITSSNSTLDYYDENADLFADTTAFVDMSSHYKKFLPNIPANGRILDLGCGTGRDSSAFLDMGFDVLAVDASDEMVKKAKELFGIQVQKMRFEELGFEAEFDGVWACASLLHVPFENLQAVITKALAALKENGTMYISFKYGDGERVKDGRFFTDMNEERLTSVFQKTQTNIEIETWVTSDVRKKRDMENWLNALVHKKSTRKTPCA